MIEALSMLLFAHADINLCFQEHCVMAPSDSRLGSATHNAGDVMPLHAIYGT